MTTATPSVAASATPRRRALHARQLSAPCTARSAAQIIITGTIGIL
jgi:hypothetical protein